MVASIDSERFLRQILLSEVGERGQRAIGEAVAHVGGDSLAHEVATLYAEGAGFAGVAKGEIHIDRGASADLVHDETARQVLAGARAALVEIRRALSSGEGDPA